MKIRRHLSRRFGRVVFLGLILSSFAMPLFAQVKVARTCDRCSAAEKEECAGMMAQYYGLVSGDMAWIIDFAGSEVALFLINASLTEDGADAQKAQTSGIGGAPEAVSVSRHALTDEQAEGAEALIQVGRELVWPGGLAFNIRACGPHLLDTPEQSVHRRAELQRQWDQRVIRLHKDVPAGIGPSSIHGVIGDLELALQLAQNIAPPAQLLADEGHLSNPAGPEATTWPNATLRLDFADGSSGIWRLFPKAGVWIPDWTLFRDSDLNQIPLTTDDMQVGMGFSFSSQTNLEWFLEHAAGLGIPIDRESGTDGAVTCVRDYRRLHCQPRYPQG